MTGAAGFILQGVASAHSVSITAAASCKNNTAVIDYTVTSWNQVDIAGTNTEVDVLFNGVKVDAQAFKLNSNPPNQFSGEAVAPAASPVTVQASVVGAWGDGFPSGQSASVSVTVPTDCGFVD